MISSRIKAIEIGSMKQGKILGLLVRNLSLFFKMKYKNRDKELDH